MQQCIEQLRVPILSIQQLFFVVQIAQVCDHIITDLACIIEIVYPNTSIMLYPICAMETGGRAELPVLPFSLITLTDVVIVKSRYFFRLGFPLRWVIVRVMLGRKLFKVKRLSPTGNERDKVSYRAESLVQLFQYQQISKSSWWLTKMNCNIYCFISRKANLSAL